MDRRARSALRIARGARYEEVEMTFPGKASVRTARQAD
jgi:hypothetical protein